MLGYGLLCLFCERSEARGGWRVWVGLGWDGMGG